MRRIRRTERGVAPVVELVVLTPALVAFFLLMVALGRVAQARGDVDGAARDAARAASIRLDPGAAAVAAQDTATATLSQRSITCQSLAVATDTSAFQAGGWVAVDVSCSVNLSDLTLLGVPGTKTYQSHFVVPIDPHRGGGS